MNVNKYFDKIYVVTTKRLTNRHIYIAKHLKNLDIEFTFIYGPDKKDINVEQYNISDNLHTNNQEYRQHEIACLISHSNAWKSIINSNFEKCLILEDDCFFHPNFIKKNNLFLKNIENINWDLIQYGWIPPELKREQDLKINNFVIKQWCFVAGAHCYAITKKTAKILLDNLIFFKNDFKHENCGKLYRKGVISKSVDGYIGDLSNPHTKKNNKIYIQSYRPFECLAFDCSHGNKHTNIKFSVFSLNE
jgi:GR25 family glycosyltransferase involved in LPS biosynthesis